MQTRVFDVNGSEVVVEELSRSEFLYWALYTIESVFRYESFDETLWVEYKDGTHYSCAYFDNDTSDNQISVFRKTNIVFGVVRNGMTQKVFGDYIVDEDGFVRMR